MKYYLGIDIGASSFKSGVIDEDNNIVYQNSIPTVVDQTNEKALDNLSILIDDVLSKDKIESIGIGIPCVVNDEKIKMSPNLPNWNNIDFGSYLRNKYVLPIAIDNDANAAAFAELIAGNGKKYDNFVYITLGTGVGGAIVINRQIYHGNIGGAGEIGHIIVNINQRNIEPKYRNGVLEARIGKQGIIDAYNTKRVKNKLERITDIDVKDIVDMAENEDEIALKTIAETGYYLGVAIVNINNILDIKNFIIGGGISQSKLIKKAAGITTKIRSLPSVSNIKITRAKFIQNTGIVGAALLGKMQGKIKIKLDEKTKTYQN
jgi:glucokinase